jgi:folate-binding Fe-S cluster repair protein YgfZ
MLNFQATGAISFKKGCYTGQEVVARMQYLGKLKRHMYRLILVSSAVPEPGTDVFVPGNSQSVGTLVYAAPVTAHECEALVVLKDDMVKTPTLLLGPQSVTVRAADLPYTLDKA